MGTFMTRIPRCVYIGIGVIMGSVIKSARMTEFGYKIYNLFIHVY